MSSGPSQNTTTKRRARAGSFKYQNLKITERLSEWSSREKSNELDPCDCPNIGCEGCWYPCEKCGSVKCSPFCRRIRNSMEMREPAIEWKPSH